MSELESQLAQLDHRARVAFAAACAQRMLIVYKYMCTGEVVRYGPTGAVKTAWLFATGEPVGDEQRAKVKARLEQAYPEREPDTGGGPEDYSVSATDYALAALDEAASARSARLAAEYACAAIEGFDDEGGVDEERAWQARALQLARQWTGQGDQRAAFEALIAETPGWQVRMEAG